MLCVEYLSKGCESITKDVSIIEPDIDNSTTTGEGENNAACSSSRGINLISKEGTKKFGTILDLSRKWHGSWKGQANF